VIPEKNPFHLPSPLDLTKLLWRWRSHLAQTPKRAARLYNLLSFKGTIS
jgi:hypothetical protein